MHPEHPHGHHGQLLFSTSMHVQSRGTGTESHLSELRCAYLADKCLHTSLLKMRSKKSYREFFYGSSVLNASELPTSGVMKSYLSTV